MATHILKTWFPLAFAVSAIMLTAYVAIQQDLRQSANDPQIQISEDGAAALALGFPPAALVTQGHTDMAKSLSPFLIIYNASGTPVASTGYLDGRMPEMPAGVLSYAALHHGNRLTWQPAPGVRIATAVMPYSVKPATSTATSTISPASPTGYIVVGRSLREVESRIGFLGLTIFLGWLATMIVTLLIYSYAYAAEARQRALDSLR